MSHFSSATVKRTSLKTCFVNLSSDLVRVVGQGAQVSRVLQCYCCSSCGLYYHYHVVHVLNVIVVVVMMCIEGFMAAMLEG